MYWLMYEVDYVPTSVQSGLCTDYYAKWLHFTQIVLKILLHIHDLCKKTGEWQNSPAQGFRMLCKYCVYVCVRARVCVQPPYSPSA
jgi:hypothetical protein